MATIQFNKRLVERYHSDKKARKIHSIFSLDIMDEPYINLEFKIFCIQKELRRNPMFATIILGNLLLIPKYWEIFIYVYKPGLYIQNIKLSDIYKKCGREYTKKVILNSVCINYDWSILIRETCKVNDLAMVKFLNEERNAFERYSRIDYSLPGITGFMEACGSESMEVIEYLLEHTKVDILEGIIGSNLVLGIYDRRYYDMGTIIYTCANGQFKVFKLLISLLKSQGVNIHDKISKLLYNKRYNLATISIAGCNQELTDYLISKYGLQIQSEFIYEICTFGTGAMLKLAHSYLGNVYFSLEHCTDSVLEYIIQEIDPNLFDSLNIETFLNFARTKSIPVQEKLIQSNMQWFTNYDDSNNAIRDLCFKFMKLYGNNKPRCVLSQIITTMIYIKLAESPYPITVLNGNYSLENRTFDQIEQNCIISYKYQNTYYISKYNYESCAKFYGYLSYLKIDKKMAIDNWTNSFFGIMDRRLLSI